MRALITGKPKTETERRALGEAVDASGGTFVPDYLASTFIDRLLAPQCGRQNWRKDCAGLIRQLELRAHRERSNAGMEKRGGSCRRKRSGFRAHDSSAAISGGVLQSVARIVGRCAERWFGIGTVFHAVLRG